MTLEIYEKRFSAIPATLFTADGRADGLVTVPNACDFKVKQQIEISATGLPQLPLEVKRVVNETEMFVGPRTPTITDRTDLSAYTTATSAFIFAIEQKRPSIPFEEHTRAVYEEEPTVAVRSILVDKLGDHYALDNPLPVQLSDGSIDIGTVNAELEVQLSHQDNVPDAGDVADSVQIGDGTEILEVNPDGSINVVITPGPTVAVEANSTFGEITSLAASTTATVVSYTVPVGKSATLEIVEVSGTNIAQYTVEVNAVVVDRKYTWHNGPMSERFDFMTTNGGSIILSAGDVVRVRVNHIRSTVGDFNARIDVVEIG